MKFMTMICILLLSLSSQAVTKGFFPFTGLQAMVTMATSGSMGDSDPDPQKLYSEMLVEPQDSFIGRGKTIKTKDDIMNLVCADRNNGTFNCTLIVKKGAGTDIRMSQKYFEYRLTGPEAAEIFELFKHANKGEYLFENGDQRLKILSRPDLLHIKFQDY